MLIRYIIRPLFIRLIVNITTLYSVVYVFPAKMTIEGGVYAYVLIALILGLLNAIIKPLLKLVSMPFMIVSFGLFIVLINGFILYLTEGLIGGFTGETVNFSINGGFMSYILVAIIFGILNYIVGMLFGVKSK